MGKATVVRRLLLSILLVGLAGLASAQRDGPPGDASVTGPARSVREIASMEEAVRAEPNPRRAADRIAGDLFASPSLKETLRRMRQGDAKAREDALRVLGSFRLGAETRLEAEALAKVRAIKSGPEYRTPKQGTASTWFGRMLEAFSRWLQATLRRWFGGSSAPNVPNLNLQMPGWIIYLVWGLLGIVILVAAIPLVRLIRFRVERRKRKVKGLLEEEPERTKSEYLTLGDDLAARGEFRAAIRMRYLAALKRFDEARVARFDRGETNWEHLARIRASATLPPGLDFRPPTAAFDHYWYGHRPAGQADYDRFVAWYDEVDGALRGVTVTGAAA